MQIKDLIPWARKDAPASKSAGDNPVATLQRDMNQALETFWGRFGQGFGNLEWPWGNGEARSDVVETDDAVEVTIELPGMEMKDIDVTVTDDMLTIKGEKKTEEKKEDEHYHLVERSYGSVMRQIALPNEVAADKIAAEFDKGVLRITLPKSPQAAEKTRKIAVKAK